MVYTFIYCFHSPVYIYRVGMRRPSGTPVPSSCPRYPPTGEQSMERLPVKLIPLSPNRTSSTFSSRAYILISKAVRKRKDNFRTFIPLFLWRFKWATSWENLFLPYANNKDADQPAHGRSLISAFVVHCLDSIIPILAKSKHFKTLANLCSWAG